MRPLSVMKSGSVALIRPMDASLRTGTGEVIFAGNDCLLIRKADFERALITARSRAAAKERVKLAEKARRKLDELAKNADLWKEVPKIIGGVR